MPSKVQKVDALGALASKWFETLDDRGVFITDDQLIVRRWNQWLCSRTGKSAADVIGQLLQVGEDRRGCQRSSDQLARDIVGGGAGGGQRQ